MQEKNIDFTDVNNKPPVQLEWDMKLWWPQCETIMAMSLAYLLFKEDKYKQKYEEIEEYCKKYFIDKKYGEALFYENNFFGNCGSRGVSGCILRL